MNAAFYAHRPQRSESVAAPPKRQRTRRMHRLVATIFTLTVAANFAAMPWGTPPAWLTYAPLPPLLFLLATGLVMLVSPSLAAARAARKVGAR